jgi:release factor glutamine methyltransferase
MMMMRAKKADTLAKEALRWAVMKLQQEHIESASLDARILLEYVLGVNREQLLFSLELPITTEQYDRFAALVAKRAKRQPVSKIISRREFWGINFAVNENTLDPRPDSETLIECVLERVENRDDALRILDLGTGTGCLLLSLLSELPAATGIGIDASEGALLVAKENAVTLGFTGRTDFMLGDWCSRLEGKFDIIISNPPYIPTEVISTLEPEVAEFDPMLALDGGADGLNCYRKIMKQLSNILAKDGFAAFEIGIGQQNDLAAIANENGMEIAGSKNDLSGIARCLIIQNKKNNYNH